MFLFEVVPSIIWCKLPKMVQNCVIQYSSHRGVLNTWKVEQIFNAM